MRIGILNQFVPPEQPPTARLAGDLAEALRRSGHEVVCVGSAARYGTAGGMGRVLRDIKAHASMAWQVLCAGKLDWIVCFSDPIGLPLAARVLAGLKGARLAHWAMDVYPQIAVSLGVVREGVVSRAVAAGMRVGYQGCDLVVALDQDMAKEISSLSGKSVEVLAPWPPEVRSAGEAKEAEGPSCRRWVYSGNLGRAHEFRTLLETQRLLEARGCDWELHFQGGGPVRGEAEALAAQLGLQRCHWTGYFEEERLVHSLMAADVLIATQRPETRGLLWPSKLALMRHVGVPLVWVGPTEGAIAEWLRAEVTATKILVEQGESEALADWLEALPKRTECAVPLMAVQEKVMAERQAGCDWWQARLTSI